MPNLITAIAIFAGFFAFSWVIANRVGRVATPPGSHPSGHAAYGVDGASRFDPSRGGIARAFNGE